MAKPKTKRRKPTPKKPHRPLAAAKGRKEIPKRARASARKKLAKRTAMPWRVAYSLDALLAQVNARAPNRSKASDGSIGDAAHASRASDHNPWRKAKNGQPIVGARDITHDPRGGMDSYVLARSIVADPRNWDYLSYVISNGQIWSIKNKKWVKYTGSNPHDHHAHFSTSTVEKYWDAKPTWYFKVLADNAKPDGSVPGDVPAKPVATDPLLKRGMKETTDGPIHEAQRMLGVKADGDFGPGTERATKAFQVGRGLSADGVIGPDTWRALRAAELAAPTSVPASAPPVSDQQILEYLVEDEGPELNVHSDEPGGASRYGVSISALSKALGRQATIQDLKDLTPQSAWDKVYVPNFWHEIGAEKLPAGLNYAAFDFAVNSGPAIVDGDDTNNPTIVRDFLVEAMKEKTVGKQIDKLCDLRLEYMKTNPVKWERYKRGWSARVSRVRFRAHKMAA